MRKISLLALILPILSSPIHPVEFNLGKELRKANKISNTFDLIATFQNIVSNINKKSLTRLSKRVIRKLKVLHKICINHDDSRVKGAFVTLLKTALENEKLRSVDYENELPELLKQWEKLDKTFIDESEVEVPTTEDDQASQEFISPLDKLKDDKRRELIQKMPNLNKKDLRLFLILKKILNRVKDIDQIEEKLNDVEDILARRKKINPMTKTIEPLDEEDEYISPLLQNLPPLFDFDE